MPGKTRELSEGERMALLIRYIRIKDGASTETLSELCNEFTINKCTPSQIFNKAQSCGTLRNQSKSGRPTVQTAEKQAELVNEIRTNRKVSCRSLARKIKVFPATAARLCTRMGFRP